MATRKKQRRGEMSSEQLQHLYQQYEAETGAEELDMKKVAAWAIGKGLWKSPPYDPVKACAKALSRAAREEYYVDPQGREVRKRHCYVMIDESGQKFWHWVDIITAKPDPMHRSLQWRRRNALGDVSQLARDLESYNENNKYGAQLQMSFNFDEDLAEANQPTEYPERPDGSEDEPMPPPKG